MKIYRQIILTVAAILGVSCSKDGADDSLSASRPTAPEGTTAAIVTPDDERILLKNPLSGWVLYSGIGSGLADNFWDVYDNMDCPDAPGGKVKLSDYSNVLYIKADWSAINPADNVYIWTEEGYEWAVQHLDEEKQPFARNLKYLMDGAKERGMKIAFTINTNSEDDAQSSTPKFVEDAGAKGYYTGASVFSGYPDDPIFQQYYEKFVKAFAARFNNPDEVEFISGLGLGKWGECHSFRYSTENTLGKGDESPRWAVYNWVTSLYADNFTRVPVVTNYHKMVGRTVESGTADQMSQDLLDLAISKGFAMRHDAFGMKSWYGTWEKSFIRGRRYKVPVIGEGGWVQSSHEGSWQGDYATVRELREGEYSDMQAACVNMMDLRYSSDMMTSETWSWFNDAYDLVLKFLREGVYRLNPYVVYLPETAAAGSSVLVQSRWENRGTAYFPANLKQWEGKYKMAYALLDSGTDEPLHVFVDDKAALETVTNVARIFDTTIDLTDVQPGTYTWAIGIVNIQKSDASGNPVPSVEMSVAEDDLTDEGWLRLADIEIQ